MTRTQQNGSSSSAPTDRATQLSLRDLIHLVRRNVWLILAVAGTIIGGTAYLTWTTLPVYEASAPATAPAASVSSRHTC